MGVGGPHHRWVDSAGLKLPERDCEDPPRTQASLGPASGGAIEESVSRRGIRGIVWTAVGYGTQAVLQLFVLALLARLLVPADFGLFTAAVLVVGFSEVLARLGMAEVLVQRPVLEAYQLKAASMFVVTLSLVAAIISPLVARYRGIFFAMLLSNVLFLLVGLVGAKVFSRISLIPTTLLWPTVFALCFVGAYGLEQSIVDVWIMMIAGLLGFVLKRYGFSPAPIIMGLVLGTLVETSLAQSMIPLGSCTMKLNAAAEMMPVSWPEFGGLHPFAPLKQTRGYQELFADLEQWLAEMTGFADVSLQPNAGSQGEYAGLLVIRAFHENRGEGGRDVCLIPMSAHGTNPASAVLAGLRVVPVKCNGGGDIDHFTRCTRQRESLCTITCSKRHKELHGLRREAAYHSRFQAGCNDSDGPISGETSFDIGPTGDSEPLS